MIASIAAAVQICRRIDFVQCRHQTAVRSTRAPFLRILRTWAGALSEWFILKVNFIKHFLSFSVSAWGAMSCRWLQSKLRIQIRNNIERRGLVRRHRQTTRKICWRNPNPTHEYKTYSQMEGLAWIWWHSCLLHCSMHQCECSKREQNGQARVCKSGRVLWCEPLSQTNQTSLVTETTNVFIIIMYGY